MVRSLLGQNAATSASLDQAITEATAESSVLVLRDEATIWRIERDSGGKTVTEPVGAEDRPVQRIVYQGPANLLKPGKTRFKNEAGGREDIADWELETPLDYNPETGDEVEINGFRHHVKGSNEGETGAATRRIFLLRTGRLNRGV